MESPKSWKSGDRQPFTAEWCDVFRAPKKTTRRRVFAPSHNGTKCRLTHLRFDLGRWDMTWDMAASFWPNYCWYPRWCRISAINSSNYLEPNWPLFLKVNPPKQGRTSNQNKAHLGSRYIHYHYGCFSIGETEKHFRKTQTLSVTYTNEKQKHTFQCDIWCLFLTVCKWETTNHKSSVVLKQSIVRTSVNLASCFNKTPPHL